MRNEDRTPGLNALFCSKERAMIRFLLTVITIYVKLWLFAILGIVLMHLIPGF